MNDIKRVLATALEGEPPVRIDRAKVIENGRRRLLGRRIATAGGAALAVAAVFLSATFVLGGGRPEELPVGAAAVGSSATGSLTDAGKRLTKALNDSGIVPGGLTLRPVDSFGEPLQFLQKDGRFEAAADLVDKQGNEGTMFVMVADQTAAPTCAPPNECEQRTINGRAVQLTTAPLGSAGEILLMAHTRLPNGVQVYAMTSNVSAKATERTGKAASAPTTPQHLLTLDQLGQIVGLADLKL